MFRQGHLKLGSIAYTVLGAILNEHMLEENSR